MKRFLCLLLCLILTAALPLTPVLAAVPWPEEVSISAEGGVVMDARSGAVLYGKNIHQAYYPASITKILTALIVIESCSLDETVTFSHNAVYNVEAGSSSAGLDEGDQLSVRDCLYAMLLKSANEAANALAEHVAGSTEAFAQRMNEKAASLGCTDSHFSNPSGLNDPDHYTSAMDMALIAQAAFENETFVTIDSTLYYDLPATKKNPQGGRVYPGHKMLKKNLPEYYPGIIGGKTGYTSLAGNTLVTCAERDGMKLIAVILNGHQTHYSDTKALLDFGFSNFRSLELSQLDTTYSSLNNDMTIAGLPSARLSLLHIQEGSRITLPAAADFSEAVSSLSYELPASAPQRAVAEILYDYSGHSAGHAWLLHADGSLAQAQLAEVPSAQTDAAAAGEGASASSDTPAAGEGTSASSDAPAGEGTSASSDAPAADKGTSASSGAPEENTGAGKMEVSIPRPVWIALGAAAVIAAAAAILLFIKFRIEKKEEEERSLRYQRRQERLQDIGMSTVEFDLLMQQKRSDSALKQNKPHRIHWPWKRR